MHKVHIPSPGRWFELKKKTPFLYTKILCTSFLLMLNDVPLGASKEGRNYPSSEMVRLADWAILCLRYSGPAELYVRFLGSKRQVQKGCYRLDSCKALGNPEQEEGRTLS